MSVHVIADCGVWIEGHKRQRLHFLTRGRVSYMVLPGDSGGCFCGIVFFLSAPGVWVGECVFVVFVFEDEFL